MQNIMVAKQNIKSVVEEIKTSKSYFENDKILIFNEDILKITAIPENSVDLIVTSPPYNVDIHYNSHADNLTYDDYLEFTQKWIRKCFDLAKKEGRFLLNIPLDKNKGGQKSALIYILTISSQKILAAKQRLKTAKRFVRNTISLKRI